MTHQAMDDSVSQAAAAPGDLLQLGMRLQSARSAAGWSVGDVAQKLHLPLGTVADLEAGQHQRIGTPIYLKGFLRSYLKLLKLPESWAQLALQASPIAAEPPILPAAGAVARRIPWLDRYKWAASYVVGTALALTAVHWLVSNTPQLGLPEASRSVPLALDTSPILPVDVSADEATATADPIAPVAAIDTPESWHEPPLLASLSPFRSAAETRDDGANGNGGLLLTLDQDSWVEVRNASGERLTYATLRAGERRRFSEGAPFFVRVGNVRGVRAEVGGQPFALDPLARGNVARFVVSRTADGWSAAAPQEPTVPVGND